MVSGEVPVPARLTTCGLVNALSYTCNWPSRTPPMLGSNSTETVQDAEAPAPPIPVPPIGQVVADSMKSPVSLKLLMISAKFGGSLVMVKVTKGLGVPTGAEKIWVVKEGLVKTCSWL